MKLLSLDELGHLQSPLSAVESQSAGSELMGQESVGKLLVGSTVIRKHAAALPFMSEPVSTVAFRAFVLSSVVTPIAAYALVQAASVSIVSPTKLILQFLPIFVLSILLNFVLALSVLAAWHLNTTAFYNVYRAFLRHVFDRVTHSVEPANSKDLYVVRVTDAERMKPKAQFYNEHDTHLHAQDNQHQCFLVSRANKVTHRRIEPAEV